MGKEEIAGAAVAAAETRAEMMESNHQDEETVAATSRVIDSDALLQTGWLGLTNGFGAGH